MTATLTAEPRTRPASSPDVPRRWSLRRWAQWTVVLAIVVSLVAIGAGGYAIVRLSDAREKVVDQLDPAASDVLSLTNALINQETGVRGFALSAQDDFLAPYTQGRQDESAAVAALRASLGGAFPQATADLNVALQAARAWQAGYAEPTIAAVRASGAPLPTGNVGSTVDQGKALFDQVRSSLATISTYLGEQRATARRDLAADASLLQWTFTIVAAALLGAAIMLTVGLTRGVIRPITGLTRQVRQVAGGDFAHPVEPAGPDEIHQLGADVESMRVRILTELSALQEANDTLDAQSFDLRRSNAELEQFAYVASHDLQEPLRKVASFCELLESRYTDELDERGRMYIGFAVDGATRMQHLINDLLAFSRVGRTGGDHVLVDGGAVVDQALGNLSTVIENTGATVTVPEMPPLYGDAALLTAVFQNLISNAIKFRRPDTAPVVAITIEDAGDEWLFTCTDDGIGIEPEYAERIFVIFQRLHAKSSYPGTGIGLAMCRKIVEYHGGRIWLDTTRAATEGTRIRFTLPAATAESRLTP